MSQDFSQLGMLALMELGEDRSRAIEAARVVRRQKFDPRLTPFVPRKPLVWKTEGRATYARLMEHFRAITDLPEPLRTEVIEAIAKSAKSTNA